MVFCRWLGLSDRKYLGQKIKNESHFKIAKQTAIQLKK